MLFNMPRTPFTRTQRIAAFEWPTMESFSEYEGKLEANQSDSNNAGRQDMFHDELAR